LYLGKINVKRVANSHQTFSNVNLGAQSKEKSHPLDEVPASALEKQQSHNSL
jgi:hypothetical protein